MTEKIIQGGETPAETAARRAAWDASVADRVPDKMQTSLDDLERALLAKGALTAADIAQAKRSR